MLRVVAEDDARQEFALTLDEIFASTRNRSPPLSR